MRERYSRRLARAWSKLRGVRFARIATSNGHRYARLDGDRAHLLDGPPWSNAAAAHASLAWTEGDLVCPVEPTKIVCVGRNYAAHAKELGNDVPSEPLLFLKPPSSLLGPGGTVVLPTASARVEHESELGVVIGKRTRDIEVKDALEAVFGFTTVNDVTARDLQKKDGQWTRAKGFDTFCPVGPWIETELDPASLRVLCRVNGAVRQDARTSQMIFDVPTLISYISHVMTLEPGDLLVTGTPEGVGPLLPGDICEVEITDERQGREPARLGVLRVTVRGSS
jgi:2-keto-4-pentenoate hydratase/2-oxohepta-3-ene-1,7-dioic acid hydratase in catechol pathway